MNLSIGNHLQIKQEIHLRKIYITDIPTKFNVKIWLIEKEANQLLWAHQQKICNYVLFLEVGKQKLKNNNNLKVRQLRRNTFLGPKTEWVENSGIQFYQNKP